MQLIPKPLGNPLRLHADAEPPALAPSLLLVPNLLDSQSTSTHSLSL